MLQGIDHQLITTKDGSCTFFSDHFQETYHSVHGARGESEHVFIQHGLKALPPASNEITILETGLGTGLNLLLTFLQDQTSASIIHYVALELYPLPDKAIQAYIEQDSFVSAHSAIFNEIHNAPWNTRNSLSLNFDFIKKLEKIEDLCDLDQYDLIYFDAFAPDTQPELWTEEIMVKMFRALKKGGLLVTYCAKGQVKRNMKAAGFLVEKLPGPTGKREMTRATKPF